MNFRGRDIVSIKDLKKEEILHILDVARDMVPIAEGNRKSNLLEGKLMASLFFEPSTRTRLSFEAAMKRLGGNVIGFAQPGATSMQKGESLADTIRTAESYSDVIVMRHPQEGSARMAAEPREWLPNSPPYRSSTAGTARVTTPRNACSICSQ